ncbi:bifunctional (p)ppGpp synthetase/guanosine-3',5'-bis(diphosphate) 3'-pyrophosphohydrolase [Candidatus Chlorohelix sp.]|uniref:RelA/SpoT family protein n=1 Tax=Candidatus Chlorohelix sp. TaxID=3139201 RepID=UPI00305706EA
MYDSDKTPPTVKSGVIELQVEQNGRSTEKKVGGTAVEIPDTTKLIAAVSASLPQSDIAIIERAIHFAAAAHAGQSRASGEPYVAHPISAAITIAEMKLDRDSVIAALLHDVPEDTHVTIEQIHDVFGEKVAKLVDGVTKLGKIKWDPGTEHTTKAMHEKQEQAENLRKMFLAMVDDVRVVLIKLADRLHNMQTLQFKSREKQIKIATETLEIFAPLANRLGIWNIKWQLEDLCFFYLHPDNYKEITVAIYDQRETLQSYLEKVINTVEKAFEEQGIHVLEVTGRPKHIYSIYKKMMRKNRPFDQIYDLLAIRIMVEDVRDCYAALGVIHTLWRPIPGEFDDYIANPKESMYQSLHTAVLALDGRSLEVQIRTKQMHEVAEYGIAAHWRYKEGGKRDVEFEAKIAWLRRLIDWREDSGDNSDAMDFVETLKSDVFQDQVYVFTPRGDIIDLPAGATPIDFAYRIHTDIGHTCGGARVNDRLVPLSYQLQNGEVVKIVQVKNRKGPSRDWLNQALGYIKTAGARDKVKQWFRKQERDDNLAHGRDILETELKRLGLDNISFENVASHFPKYDKTDDFLAALGYGGITINAVANRLLEEKKTQQSLPEFAQPNSIVTSGNDKAPILTANMQVSGMDGLLTSLAKCCHPVPGDEVVGYVTMTKGISVHRSDCSNILHIPEKDQGRLMRVNWGDKSVQYYRVPIRMEAMDRVGLLRDISVLVADENINMSDFRTLPTNSRGIIPILFNVDVTSVDQLYRVFHKLQGVKDALEVRRDVPNSNRTKS